MSKLNKKGENESFVCLQRRRLYRHCVYSGEVQRTSVPSQSRWGCLDRRACSQSHSGTPALCPLGTSSCWSPSGWSNHAALWRASRSLQWPAIKQSNKKTMISSSILWGRKKLKKNLLKRIAERTLRWTHTHTQNTDAYLSGAARTYRRCEYSGAALRTSIPQRCRWWRCVRWAGNRGRTCAGWPYPQGTSSGCCPSD